jgi:hypothetical protein
MLSVADKWEELARAAEAWRVEHGPQRRGPRRWIAAALKSGEKLEELAIEKTTGRPARAARK